jgi:hypothetical protein
MSLLISPQNGRLAAHRFLTVFVNVKTMEVRHYYKRAAGALSMAMVIAGAIPALSPANITWLAGLAMTYLLCFKL